MNRSDITKMVSNREQLPLNQVDRVVGSLLDILSVCLAAGEPVNLRTFGKFEHRHRRAITLKNPRTGVDMDIPDKTTVVFIPSVNLKNRLNPED